VARRHPPRHASPPTGLGSSGLADHTLCKYQLTLERDRALSPERAGIEPGLDIRQFEPWASAKFSAARPELELPREAWRPSRPQPIDLPARKPGQSSKFLDRDQYRAGGLAKRGHDRRSRSPERKRSALLRSRPICFMAGRMNCWPQCAYRLVISMDVNVGGSGFDERMNAVEGRADCQPGHRQAWKAIGPLCRHLEGRPRVKERSLSRNAVSIAGMRSMTGSSRP
jgi:hypothetical protein